ncbi:MAG: limonene-1,2-epoxide hydrolase family protein [Ilumatobacteraceae bacterium]
MSEVPPSPRQVVEAFLEAFAAMDFERALPYLADDCEYTNVPMGTVRGHEGVREVLGPFFAPILENEFVLTRTAADGPVVFVERLDRHRLNHGWRELPVTGVFEVHDGRIAVWRDYFDLVTASKIHDPGPS